MTWPARMACARDSGRRGHRGGGRRWHRGVRGARIGRWGDAAGHPAFRHDEFVGSRSNGIPVGDLAVAVSWLAEGMPRAIDVGAVNGHVFLCGSMIGPSIRLVRYREAWSGMAAGCRSRW